MKKTTDKSLRTLKGIEINVESIQILVFIIAILLGVIMISSISSCSLIGDLIKEKEETPDFVIGKVERINIFDYKVLLDNGNVYEVCSTELKMVKEGDTIKINFEDSWAGCNHIEFVDIYE